MRRSLKLVSGLLFTLCGFASPAIATDYGPYFCYGCGNVQTANGAAAALAVHQTDLLARRLGDYPNAPQGVSNGDKWIICDGNMCIYVIWQNLEWITSPGPYDTGGYLNWNNTSDFTGEDGCRKTYPSRWVTYQGVYGRWAYVYIGGNQVRRTWT